MRDKPQGPGSRHPDLAATAERHCVPGTGSAEAESNLPLGAHSLVSGRPFLPDRQFLRRVASARKKYFREESGGRASEPSSEGTPGHGCSWAVAGPVHCPSPRGARAPLTSQAVQGVFRWSQQGQELMAAHGVIQEVPQTEDMHSPTEHQNLPELFPNPRGQGPWKAHCPGHKRGLTFEGPPGCEKPCSGDSASGPAVVTKAPRDHGGDSFSLQILSTERGRALSKVRREPRRHLLEVGCGSNAFPLSVRLTVPGRRLGSDCPCQCGPLCLQLAEQGGDGIHPLNLDPRAGGKRVQAETEGGREGGKSLLGARETARAGILEADFT